MDMEMKDVADLALELKKRTDEVKAIASDFTEKSARGEKMSQDAKDGADVATKSLNELRAEIAEFEQKHSRKSADDKQTRKSIGQQFIEEKSFVDLAAKPSQRGRAEMQIKATITSAITDVAGSAGDAVFPQVQSGIMEMARQRLYVRDLLTPGTMSSSSLEYVKETGFTNSAAPVAEAAVKPQSDIKLDLVTTSAKVIAHYAKASRQILSDAPQLQSLIDGRLLYGLKAVEEAQLLNGTGVGQNLLGLIPQASAYAAPGGLTGTTPIDQLRLALLQAELALYPSTGIVMNPIDWARLELLKDTTGQYLIGNPQGSIAASLWSLPVVATPSIAQDKFLCGAFKLGAQIFDRWQARIEIATENEDDFIKNLVTILCEERLAFAVYRPESFIYGDFGFVA